MEQVEINMKKMKNEVFVMQTLKKRLSKLRDDMNAVMAGSVWKNEQDMGAVLRKILKELEEEERALQHMGSVLENITDMYLCTEKDICRQMIRTGTINGNPAFDRQGAYGGNQSNPLLDYNASRDIVRKYYPDFTDEQVRNYLKKLESEGCGYVALTNTVFKQYDGKEAEFEKTFGFPMYTEEGELNFNALITDFYAATDNRNGKHFLWFDWESVSSSEDESETKGYGTTWKSRKYRFEKYLAEHGVQVTVKNVAVNAENYDKVSKEGEIVVGVTPCILYNPAGMKSYQGEGGHAMTVTGRGKDGMLKVSSWGREFYIKPDSGVYDRIEFQQICYEKGKE